MFHFSLLDVNFDSLKGKKEIYHVCFYMFLYEIDLRLFSQHQHI